MATADSPDTPHDRPADDELPPDTAFIVRGAQADDRNAWVLLSAKVAFFLRTRFGNVSLPAEIEFDDFASEVMVRLLAEIGRFQDRGKGSFWGWVYALAQNKLNDLWRAHQRYDRVRPLAGGGGDTDSDLGPRSLDDLSDPNQVSVTESCEVRELEGIEHDCVQRLPAGMAQIYLLRRQQDLPFHEISPLVGGVKEVTLRSYFKRARDFVKGCIRDKIDRLGRTFGDWLE
ncbi:MAG: RNA polymerase sigma factor [Planctomycetes bacterium]|nr:RNA polymerase sigma factor [Planctomycetota bacterium]